MIKNEYSLILLCASNMEWEIGSQAFTWEFVLNNVSRKDERMRLSFFLLKTSIWINVKNDLCNPTFLFAHGFRSTVKSFVRGLVTKIAAPEEITIMSHFHFFHILLREVFLNLF